MNRFIPAAALFLLLTTAAQAEDAMVTACMAQPSGLPQAKCVCLRNELRRVLSTDEMRVQILAFQGKYRDLRHKVDAMGPAKGQDFTARVDAALRSDACNR